MDRVQTAGTAVHVAGAKALVLLAALVSFGLSVSLWFTGNHDQGIFVGLWVPSILSLGALVVPGRRR